MKYTLIILLIPFFLFGCVCNPVYVDKPVWTPPKFDKPERPTLVDVAENKTDGEVVRIVELNFLNVMEYAEKLEKIVESIK